jgi:hypothetical protein
MKTIIFVWTHEFNIDKEHLNKYNHYNETNFFFGLGDLIRATIKLFHLSKSMNFNFIVDLQLHPISEYLVLNKHVYSDFVILNKNNVRYICYGGLEDYIHETSSDEPQLIFTNDFFEGDISEECKIFIKNIFTPTNIYKKFIDSMLSSIPFNEYNIMHYRLNDNEFLNIKNDTKYEEQLNILNEHVEYNDILVSDTKKFKDYVFFNSDIFMFDTKICHLGLSKDSDEIRDTLFEFFLILNAKKIKTYCRIHSISGFINWASKIYDIPVFKI